MNCECGYQSCGDCECDSCDELLCTGMCPSCHAKKGENCHQCLKEIEMNEEKYIRTVSYNYFCNHECFEKWK